MRAHVIDHYDSMARAREEREADPSAPTNARYWGKPDMHILPPCLLLTEADMAEGFFE